MTTETLTALEVCCCGACEANGHQKETVRPLTAEEIAQREADAAAFASQQAEAEAAAAAKQAEKEAIAARLGLSVDELKTLLS